MFTFKEASLYYYRTHIKITADDHFINGYEFPEFDEDMSNEEFKIWLQKVCDAIGCKAGYSPTHGITFPQKPDDTKIQYIADHVIDLTPYGQDKKWEHPEELFVAGNGWSVSFERAAA